MVAVNAIRAERDDQSRRRQEHLDIKAAPDANDRSLSGQAFVRSRRSEAVPETLNVPVANEDLHTIHGRVGLRQRPQAKGAERFPATDIAGSCEHGRRS